MEDSLKYTIFKTKWGFFGFLADNTGLLRTVLPTRCYRTTKKYLLVGMFDDVKMDNNLYLKLQNNITRYYEGSYVNFKKLKFSINFSHFSRFYIKVLKVCAGLTVGKVVTYSQLAKMAGFPKAVRAVGSVLAKNPLPLLIPCHRVIRADGKIGNFSAPGGTKMKKKMLEHEKRIATKTLRH